MKKTMRITMPDGSKWDVPVMKIAENRAEYYKGDFGGSLAMSLKEETIPLFEQDEFEIEDWAANNMNWTDISEFAIRVDKNKKNPDFQEGWVNGEKEIL